MLKFTRYFLIAVLFFISVKTSATVVAYHIEIRGTINPAVARYVERVIAEAELAKANVVLIELDTPGGLLSSVREMVQSFQQSKIPIVVYVVPAGAAATSAGALLMIASHVAVMAPGTNIGAAHPVGVQGEDIKGAMREKAVNDIAAFARSMAELRKRNIKAAGEVVLKSKSFTADEALKANLIDVVATDKTALWRSLHRREVVVGQAPVTLNTAPEPSLYTAEMTLGEQVLNYLAHPNIAAILMSLGILLIYAELAAPGLGLGGILGGLCLIVAFIAFQSIPIHLGGLILLGVGIVLIVAEIFVGSGGLLSIGGSVAMVLGLLWVVDPVATDLKISNWLIAVLGGLLISGTLLIGYFISRVKLQSAEAMKSIGGGNFAGVQGYKGYIKNLTADGKSGQVLIRGELWNFISQERLNENERVVVRGVQGLTLDVIRDKE